MDYSHIVEQIARCHDYAQAQAAAAVNSALTIRNWLVGAYIVEFEQQGEDRAKYGARLLPSLAKDLRRKRYKGLSLSNLKSYRQFALAYPKLEKSQTLSGFLAATEISSSNLLGPLLGDVHQAGTALSRTSLFPSLAARADAALPWQNGAYYDSLLRGLSWSNFVELIRIENPPVGIILCAERSVQEVHFATAGMDQQLFVSRYLVELPSEQQLKDWLRQEQEQLSNLRGAKGARTGDAVSL